jgi:signal transduction histidine kinase/ligand-binding sensor domain-containing protein
MQLQWRPPNDYSNHQEAMRRSIEFIVLILILLFRPFTTSAQLDYRLFSMKDGLPQSDISGIDEDSLGYLWIGMFAGGVARFDGKTFKHFGSSEGLSNIEVSDLTIDNKGILWIATLKTISYYDGTTFKDRLKFSVSSTKRIITKDDSILFNDNLNPKWLYIHEGDTGTLAVTHPMRGILAGRKITQSEFGGFNRRTNSIIIWNGYRYRTIPVGEKFNVVFHITKTPHAFLLSTNQGVFKIPEKKDTLITVSKGNEILYHIDSAHNSYWMQRPDNVLYRSRSEKDSEKILQTNINRTFADREGNMWLGTQGKGLLKIFPAIFEKINLTPNKDEKIAVRSIWLDKNQRLWLGTISNGVFTWRNNSIENEFYSPGITYVPSIVENADSKIWVATNGGLFTFKKDKLIQQYETVRNIFSMCEGKENELLMGTVRGDILLFKNDSVDEIVHNQLRVRYILFDKNKSHYVLSTDNGLFFLKNRELINSELISQPVNVCAYSQDSVLFLGTPGYGLILSRRGEKKTYTKADGLCDDYIYSIAIKGHSVWIGTNNGINRIEFSDTWTMQDVVHYGMESGLDELETNLNAIFLTDSLLIVGTVSGAFIHRLQLASHNNLHGNKIHFTTLQFVNGEHKSLDLLHPFTNTTVIPAGYNQLLFSMNQVIKRAGQRESKYSVRIIGYDTAWSSASLQHNFDYRNLKPGKYLIQVRQQQSSRDSEIVLSKAFYLNPFFYQTLWFQAAGSLAILVFILALVNWVVRRRYQKLVLIEQIRQQEEKKLRKEISHDFHDELGNELAKLTNRLAILKIQNLLNIETYEQLNFSLQRIIQGTRDFIWSLDSDNGDVSNLLIHLKDFGERFFNEKKINFSFHGPLPHKIMLPAGYSRQINFIFKEAMTNSFRHANATQVQFGVEEISSGVRIYLQDNGVGYPTNTKSTGGLTNIRNRAIKIGAVITIENQTEFFTGAKVELLIRLDRIP